MTKEIEMIELYNKSSRAFMGNDLSLGYIFRPNTQMKFSKEEADKLCAAYPKELISFDAIVVEGVTQTTFDKEVAEHIKTKQKLAEVQKELAELKKKK